MRIADGVLVAVIGLLSAAGGSWLTGRAAVDAARAQASATLAAAQAQLNVSSALKLFELRAGPISEIYAAQSKLKAASTGPAMNDAALKLATAAASAAARLDGESANICISISERATFLASVPDNMLSMKAEAFGEISGEVTRLTYEYQKIQTEALKRSFVSDAPASIVR